MQLILAESDLDLQPPPPYSPSAECNPDGQITPYLGKVFFPPSPPPPPPIPQTEWAAPLLPYPNLVLPLVHPLRMSQPPRLSVSTATPGPGPSSAAPITAATAGSSGTFSRRPMGARRRGVTPGLFVVNPDASDSESGSPVKSSTSPVIGSLNSNTSSSSSSYRGAGMSISEGSPRSLPSIPGPNQGAGQGQGQGSGSGYAAQQSHSPSPGHFPLPATPLPPLPPPQPERHTRRAYTTPVSEHPPARLNEARHASVSGTSGDHRQGQGAGLTHSQSVSSGRPALPALPTPSYGLPPTMSPPAPPEATRPLPNPTQRVASPEDSFISAGTASSDSSRSIPHANSGSGSGGRDRSESVTGQKRWVQVTTDNENFTLVDVSGVGTANAIREKIFSRLRFRDEEYSNLSLKQTEFGEDPDPDFLTADMLTRLCFSTNNLKLLVVQGVPYSGAAVVPPANTYLSSNAERRASIPKITTDLHTGGNAAPNTAVNMSQQSEVDQYRHIHSNFSRSTLNESTSTSSPLPTPPPMVATVPVGIYDGRKGSITPTAAHYFDNHNAVAGPSVPRESGLGLSSDFDMDEATRALIEQFQREEEEALRAEEQRKRQLQADEELARKEQQTEAQEWQMMQQQQQQWERDQIHRDEQRARDLAAEERRLEEQRRVDEEREFTRVNRDVERRGTYDREQAFANERRNRQHQWNDSGRMARDGSEDSWNTATHQYPAINPMFNRQRSVNEGTYQGPPADYEASQSGTYRADGPTGTYRAESTAPTGFPRGYDEQAHAQGRLSDPRLQEVNGRRATGGSGSNSLSAGAGQTPIRQNSRGTAHYPPYVPESVSAATRAMDAMRPFTPSGGGSGLPPYQNAPPRAGTNPAETRAFPHPTIYRSPSAERNAGPENQARYPDPSRATLAFPSPQPRGSVNWTETSPPLRRHSPRPSSLHDDDPSPSHRQGRPSTLHEQSSSDSARDEYYASDWRRTNTTSYPREGSPHDRGDRHPYDRQHSAPGDWLSAHSSRQDSGDTASNAGTVIAASDGTLRPRETSGSGDQEDDSGDTAKAGDWASHLRAMISNASGPAPGLVGEFDGPDEDEATLFLPSSGGSTLQRRGPSLRQPPPKPALTVNTEAATPPPGPGTDSATDSDSETATGTRIQRGKSFARPNPNQWATRPDPAQLYDKIDKFFPKIDLDKPIVEGAPSTPSTPSDSGAHGPYPPPPHHPSTSTRDSGVILSPRVDSFPRIPPVHPARGSFNKAENRKSIRYMADHKRKQIQKEPTVKETKDESSKLGRRMSMWGHKVVEVTASKLNRGQIPPALPEIAEDGKPPTLSWVKGELIGKGSYGRVYIALNLTTGDMMAVKQVELPANERDKHDKRQLSQIDSLRVEIDLLKDMYHPNIVAYLGFETSPEYLSIFLEYVPGGTIASIYRTPSQGRFEEQLVKFFTKQILEGLAYLHNRNIWHRDLKGDNILVDAAGICKISDFGISKQTQDAYDSHGQATNMKGSIFWMAPEVLHSVGDKTYSGKVDIWSLGCVVVEMWSGKRPWGEYEQVAAMLALFQKHRPALPEDLQLDSTAESFLYSKTLSIEPKDRPTARELLADPFITTIDPSWTFADSRIGRVVAQKGQRSLKTQ